jgi:D-alanine--poly(phosphoribitol) ligase subunit 1
LSTSQGRAGRGSLHERLLSVTGKPTRTHSYGTNMHTSSTVFARSRLAPSSAAQDPAQLLDEQTESWTLASIATEGAKRWPNQRAVVDDTGSLTYAELDYAVRRAATALMLVGVCPGDRVAILGDRSKGTLIALLAVSRMGATYVALDPTQPIARLSLLLDDADVIAIITSNPEMVPSSVQAPNRLVTSFAALATTDTSADDDALTAAFSRVEPSAVAYMLYTSGSTGVPKGVQIEHRSVRAFFETHNERVGIQPGDRCLSTGPFHFDVTVMDVLLPLYCGATVFLGPKQPIPTLVLKTLSDNAITHVYAVGTLLSLITGDGNRLDKYDLSALRVLQTGAEVCNVRVVNEWLRRYPELTFLNSYGPTEATVGCISFLKTEPGELDVLDCPIGLPHRTTTIRIVDAGNQAIREADVIGELLIGGPQLMRGYWRRPVENAKSLIELEGKTYYRTGDYAFVDNQGLYHFVGRIDDEIKLHGYRIHLNEVRSAILKQADVSDVVVGMVANTELVAALVLASGSAPTALRNVVNNAGERLPHYMVPTRWIVLPKMPRLPSGKTDRQSILQAFERTVTELDVEFYQESNGQFAAMEVA